MGGQANAGLVPQFQKRLLQGVCQLPERKSRATRICHRELNRSEAEFAEVLRELFKV